MIWEWGGAVMRIKRLLKWISILPFGEADAC